MRIVYGLARRLRTAAVGGSILTSLQQSRNRRCCCRCRRLFILVCGQGPLSHGRERASSGRCFVGRVQARRVVGSVVAMTASDPGASWDDDGAAADPARFRRSMCVISFTMGVTLCLPVLPVKIFLMDRARVQPAQMAFVLSAAYAPRLLKPLFGYCSDLVPICGEHRRPYIVLGIVLNVVSWSVLALLGYQSPSLAAIGVALFFEALTICLADVVVDGVIVERAKREAARAAGGLQSTSWMCRSAGAVVGGLVAMVGLDLFEHPLTIIFVTLSTTSIVSLCNVSTLCDRPGQHRAAARPSTSSGDLYRFWSNGVLLRSTLFVAILSCHPSPHDAFLYFMRKKLHFSTDLVGGLEVARHAAYFVTAGVFRTWLRQVPIRRLVQWKLVVQGVLGLGLLLVLFRVVSGVVPDALFIYLDRIVWAACSEIGFMPVVILAARLSPDGAEGTVYATFMSLMALGAIVSQQVSGVMMDLLGVRNDDFTFLWAMIVICSALHSLPLLFLRLLPDEADLAPRPKYGSVQMEAAAPGADVPDSSAVAIGRTTALDDDGGLDILLPDDD